MLKNIDLWLDIHFGYHHPPPSLITKWIIRVARTQLEFTARITSSRVEWNAAIIYSIELKTTHASSWTRRQLQHFLNDALYKFTYLLTYLFGFEMVHKRKR